MKVFQSNQNIKQLTDFTQLVAFNLDNEVARFKYKQQPLNQRYQQYIVVEQRKIVALLIVDTKQPLRVIRHGLIRIGTDKPAVFNALSTHFQSLRWYGVEYQLISNWDEHYLLQRGFDAHGTCFTKIYTYPKYFIFGGGGAHGAFQTGAFDVLKAAGIVPDVIIGVSVGAITGMSLMHLDSTTAHEVWDYLTTEHVYGVSEIGVTREKFTRTMVNQLLSRDFKSKRALYDLFLPVATRELEHPSVKFMLVTTNAKTLTQKIVAVNDQMTPSELASWVVASSAFYPVVAPMEIAGEMYIDGGYSNDVPINEAIKLGAKDIYVIDIQGMGRSQKYQVPKDVKIHWIKTKWDLGPMLDFNPQKSQDNLKLGNLEAQKFLGKLSGGRYFFTTRPNFNAFNWSSLAIYFEQTPFTRKFVPLLNNPMVEYLLRTKIGKFMGQKVAVERLSGQMLVEYCAFLLDVQPTTTYTHETFVAAIKCHGTYEQLVTKFNLPSGEWSMTYVYQHPEVILIAVVYLLDKWQKNEKNTKISHKISAK